MPFLQLLSLIKIKLKQNDMEKIIMSAPSLQELHIEQTLDFGPYSPELGDFLISRNIDVIVDDSVPGLEDLFF